MELRHLRYFVAVAEELHFRRAAERLHVAQPAISEQIRKLEQELGVLLFNRTQRRVALTPAGVALLEEARHVLRQAELAQQAARAATQQAACRVRIGYLAGALPSSVPYALRHLAASTPALRFDFQTGTAVRLIERLRRRQLDAVITTLPALTRGLTTTLIGEERVTALLPSSHADAFERSIALEQLAPEQVVTLPRETNPALYDAVVAMCLQAGLAARFVEAGESRIEHVLLDVAAGRGIGILPESTAERHTMPGIRAVPIATEQAVLQCAVVTHADTENLATHAFVRAVSRSADRLASAPPALVALSG
jgi:DNA-binding transcriptional LysR family regulator